MPKDTSQLTLRGDGAAAQDALWSGIAHDLRQPLQALLLLTHVIAGEGSVDRRAQIGREMETALLALQEMLDQTAQLTRLEAGV